MNRRLELLIVLFALNTGVGGGGVTSSLADEAGVEARIGELRGAVLSLLAPAGAVATETNPNYKGASVATLALTPAKAGPV
jgi:alcohol dehydrogenase (cytochrome c)